MIREYREPALVAVVRGEPDFAGNVYRPMNWKWYVVVF